MAGRIAQPVLPKGEVPTGVPFPSSENEAVVRIFDMAESRSFNQDRVGRDGQGHNHKASVSLTAVSIIISHFLGVFNVFAASKLLERLAKLIICLNKIYYKNIYLIETA